MSLALVPTPNAPDANTYADLAYYKGYISTRRPQPKWIGLAISGNTIDDLLTIDLIASCRLLSAAFDWTGVTATESQSLPWGRIGMRSLNGGIILPTVIPSQLKDAQCEMGVQMHDNDLLSDNLAIKAGVKDVKAGSVAVSFQSIGDNREQIDSFIKRAGSRFNYLSDAVPRSVRLLLVPSWYNEATLLGSFMLEVL